MAVRLMEPQIPSLREFEEDELWDLLFYGQAPKKPITPIVDCMLPAHDEEANIEATVESLFSQTLQPNRVIVAADNCSDNTIPILERLVDKYRGRLIYFETVDNSAKKAGALNQALQYLSHEAQYVLQMDADTKLSPNLIEEAIKELRANHKLGGVCSRFGVFPYKGKNPWHWFLWKLQEMEYATSDSSRVEGLGGTKVLSGAVVVFWRFALEQVSWEHGLSEPEQKDKGNVWSESTIVEDYSLTLDLKELGWKVQAGMGMMSWTDTMLTLWDLWDQRFRWHYGTWLELERRGWNKTTRHDILELCLHYFILVCLVIFLGTLVAMVIIGIPIQFNAIGLSVLLVAWANRLYRFSYMREPKWYDLLIAIILIPEEVYSIYRNINLTVALIRSLRTKSPQKW